MTLVAKHYLTDRNSFNATARHWAQAYAQAPASKAKPVPGKVATDAEMAGLAESSVISFTDMGFPRDKVVGVNNAGPVAELMRSVDWRLEAIE
jgi:ubiquitin-conjugating enzyme (huntingtin interacting protein 2)